MSYVVELSGFGVQLGLRQTQALIKTETIRRGKVPPASLLLSSNYYYFGIKTLERSYLLKINGKIHERPQHMLMRVSVGIH